MFISHNIYAFLNDVKELFYIILITPVKLSCKQSENINDTLLKNHIILKYEKYIFVAGENVI